MAVTTAESLSKVVDSLQNSRLPGRRPKKVGVFTMETTAHTTLLQNKINNKHDKQT